MPDSGPLPSVTPIGAVPALGLLALGAAVAAVVVAEAERGASSSPPSPVEPMTVLRADANISGPVVDDGWFAWTRGPIPYRLPMLPHTVVYVRRERGRPWRANPPGTYAQTGGIAAGKLVIQLLHYRSVLALVDLRTHRLRVLPRSINPAHGVEWRPSMSGHRLLFGRFGAAANDFRIMLADLKSGRVVRLDDVRGHGAYAEPGQVNGRYATWIACPDNHCRAYRYDVVTGRRIEMPPVGGEQYSQLGPSVTGDGTVYFGIARGCADVRLMRRRDGRVRTIYRFPAGTSYDYSHATGSGPVTVYYDETGCSPHALSRIDAIRDVVP